MPRRKDEFRRVQPFHHPARAACPAGLKNRTPRDRARRRHDGVGQRGTVLSGRHVGNVLHEPRVHPAPAGAGRRRSDGETAVLRLVCAPHQRRGARPGRRARRDRPNTHGPHLLRQLRRRSRRQRDQAGVVLPPMCGPAWARQRSSPTSRGYHGTTVAGRLGHRLGLRSISASSMPLPQFVKIACPDPRSARPDPTRTSPTSSSPASRRSSPPRDPTPSPRSSASRSSAQAGSSSRRPTTTTAYRRFSPVTTSCSSPTRSSPASAAPDRMFAHAGIRADTRHHHSRQGPVVGVPADIGGHGRPSASPTPSSKVRPNSAPSAWLHLLRSSRRRSRRA